MHEFRYKKNELYCENIKVQDLVKKYGSPLYVYSYKTIIDHFLKLKSAFKTIRPLICFSVKANSNLTILKSLVKKGAGLDIVSGGELYRAIKAGCPADKIAYASVGKTDKEIQEAVKAGILFFNAESLAELENLNRIAKKQGRHVNAAIRINPDVEPKTHKFITTGKLTNKFGIDFDAAKEIILNHKKFSHLNIKGLHLHIGSQITEGDPFVAAIKKMVSFIDYLRKEGIKLEYLNIGGGLGIIYESEKPQTAEKYAKKILPLLKKTGLKVILEPGRFIVGNAGIFVAKVLYLKKTPYKKFVIVDGGMNDLIRPALYEAYHHVSPLTLRSLEMEKVDVVGPICESGDFFAKDRKIEKVDQGDYLAVFSAGAYGFTMASNYNSRPRPAEVMVKNGKTYLIRKRETYSDLIRNE